MIQAQGHDAFAALRRIGEGWWAGFLSYDLGRAVERVPNKNPATSVPDLAFVRFDRQLTVDDTPGASPCGIGPIHWRSSLDRDAYTTAVHTIHEHLLAGNCYQVNLTRLLTTAARLDPFALFYALRTHNPAPHEAFVEIGDVAVVSASPECFLRVDGRHVTTRPIKGTSAEPEHLRASAKDRAENVMIVDLARNDLGRVCEYGSVHVSALCTIEPHPGLYHLVSTVEGRLREDTTIADVIRATFPPASVTGCPKPRVMQIIEDLEPARRGAYCGAIGFIDADRGICDLNVAIRTFTITPHGTTFGVGGGIVADSDPQAEWDETELKARRLLAIAGG